MKRNLIILLIILVFKIVGQTKESKSFGKFSKEHFGPFHNTIKDSSNKTVSTFGHYLSAGIGRAGNFGMFGRNNELVSYSLSYKSHIFSLTCGVNEGHDKNNPENKRYGTDYFGLLIGESIRYKHSLISLSAGAAYTEIGITNATRDPLITRHNGISVPIELKLFLLATKGVGFGIHISENIKPSSPYSAVYLGFCIVTGHWNNIKNIKKAAANSKKT